MATRVRWAVHFTISNFPGMGWTEPARRLVDLARLCEEVGIERMAVEDNRRHLDCFALITACLDATTTLTVESLVTDPFVRPPYLAARAVGTIADLSGGRIILGIGGGLEQPAFAGEHRVHPMQAVREMVDVCRRLWRGETVTYEGEAIRTYGASFDFAPLPHIPVLVAARGRGMLRLAGEIADVVHLASLFIDPAHQRENVAVVLEGARRSGRQPGDYEIDLSVPICISEDRTLARRAAKRMAAQGLLWTAAADEYSRNRTDWRRPSQLRVDDEIIQAVATRWNMWRQPDLPDDVAALITDDILDQFAVAGDPAECSERLELLAASVPGITGMRFKLPPPGTDGSRGYQRMIRHVGAAIRQFRADRSTQGVVHAF
jgi:5,10-methylenetetrahydromethanopterin reductase